MFKRFPVIEIWIMYVVFAFLLALVINGAADHTKETSKTTQTQILVSGEEFLLKLPEILSEKELVFVTPIYRDTHTDRRIIGYTVVTRPKQTEELPEKE